MEVVTLPLYEDLSLRAADVVCKAIRTKPDLALGLPTGETPVGMYRQLVSAHRRGEADFSRVRAFNLDEYLGLAPAHPASYHAYMREHLYAHVDISPQRARIPQGAAPEPEAECRAYEEAIAAAGYLDLAVLGIGRNGHIGFNEPGSALHASVHVARLSAETRQLAFACWAAADASLFPKCEDFPSRAITMGMGTILKSKRILLLASGESKAQAVRQAVTGPLTLQVPASLLQVHRNVTLLVDCQAAALL